MAGKGSTSEIAKRRERIEALMLMEFSRWQILELLNAEAKDGEQVSERTIERDMAEIRRSWENDGKGRDEREKLRQKMLRKAQRAENKAWLTESKCKSPTEKTGAIRTALEAQKRQSKLLGLDAERNAEKNEGTITMATLNRVMEMMAIEVASSVQEVITDEDQAAELLALIESRWASIPLDNSRPGPDRTA